MLPKSKSHIPQVNFLQKHLLEQLNPKHPLMLLSNKIPWGDLEKDLLPLYAHRGRPAKPIRLMAGLLILKQLENLSDESVVEAWIQNPYYQAFCGEEYFQWEKPCEPSDLTHFRKRLGTEGFEKIFKISANLHGKAAKERELVIDTTVQEKNITFPTDTKLRLKVIEYVLKWAKKANIQLRQTFSRKLKKLKRTVRFEKSQKNEKKCDDAKAEIRLIANKLLDEFSRKLAQSALPYDQKLLEMYRKAVNQEQHGKNKIYSLHEPQVACIAKGKEHKTYEFGSKVSFATTKTTGILVGTVNFSTNIYDGDTAIPVIEQAEKMCGVKPVRVYTDRGFKGREEQVKKATGAMLEIPDTPKEASTEYEKTKARKNFRRRCAIEPIIGHIKSDFRMFRNYLKGVIGDEINCLMAAAAFNFAKWMRLAAERLALLFFTLIFSFKSWHIFSKNYFPYQIMETYII